MPFLRNTVHYTGNDNLYNTGIVQILRGGYETSSFGFWFGSENKFYYILIQKQMFLFIWIK